VRVHDEYYLEEAAIPFSHRQEPNPEMELDERKIAQWGREGIRTRRMRVYYENGQQMYQTEEEEWLAREPLDQVFNYGTKIVERVLDTPEGPLTYWRKLRVLATSYNAPTAGKPLDHPAYAITRIGWRARKGIIAVDPRVIRLRQELYVPGYGKGIAADTGSAILWRHIDLCYDDDNLKLWYRWVDLYVLTPVPPAGQIRWIIPDSPRERR
jgi:3D (Asp-Asp-Asp) domain-containing protein